MPRPVPVSDASDCGRDPTQPLGWIWSACFPSAFRLTRLRSGCSESRRPNRTQSGQTGYRPKSKPSRRMLSCVRIRCARLVKSTPSVNLREFPAPRPVPSIVARFPLSACHFPIENGKAHVQQATIRPRGMWTSAVTARPKLVICRNHVRKMAALCDLGRPGSR
jgi:hypothetical protein